MDGILKAFRKTCPEFIFKAMTHEPRHLEVMAYSDTTFKNALQIYQNFLKIFVRNTTLSLMRITIM